MTSQPSHTGGVKTIADVLREHRDYWQGTSKGLDSAEAEAQLESIMQDYGNQREREGHRSGYVRGISDFSGYYMDASMAAQRIPILPDIARELIDGYKPPIFNVRTTNRNLKGVL